MLVNKSIRYHCFIAETEIFDIRGRYSNPKIETAILFNFRRKKSYNAVWSVYWQQPERPCSLKFLKNFDGKVSNLPGRFRYLFGMAERFERK